MVLAGREVVRQVPRPARDCGQPVVRVSVHVTGNSGNLILVRTPGAVPWARRVRGAPHPPHRQARLPGLLGAAQGVLQDLLEDMDDLPGQHIVFRQDVSKPRGKRDEHAVRPLLSTPVSPHAACPVAARRPPVRVCARLSLRVSCGVSARKAAPDASRWVSRPDAQVLGPTVRASRGEGAVTC